MVHIEIKCIHCESEKVVKMGYQRNVTPRCKCKECKKTFQTSYVNNGSKPETKRMVKMSVNGSGIRYIKSFRNKSKYSNSSFKKTEKSLQILTRNM
jgi:transposase-like protein